jgi:hypothetical protein
MEPASLRPSTPYRKLPGRLRGIGYGSSVWMAPDHLLLVSTRLFREEYKRFYLRDIQAIVMAARPRFHISTRSLAIAFAWLFPWIFWVLLPGGFGFAWWAVAAILIVSWLVFSFFFSCTCRLYTAVSNDSLPSLYRTWTARKFLDEVKPWIDEAQGTLDANWAAAVESHAAGPLSPATTTPSADVAPALPSHTTACLVLVVTLLAQATLELLTVHYVSTAVVWVFTFLSLVQLSSAILILVERQRRILRAAMQRVAVAALVVQGLIYYVAVATAAIVPSGTLGPNVFSRVMLPQFVLLREIAAAVYIVLALIGLAIILQPAKRRPPDIIEN